ncbi:T9SS type A sorting domain-containing protein [Lewinella sp. W8]|uniref:T9SS type A sorting domain-containing protein n=1 Tax=Lewinella sp. W8 TaxID=2528208 RepID=UPI00106894EB|nr:T9SS type A sorting domain-containing protein [Lewinella sp. W8]MTB53588.1 T9SS type A sorting domain-containing protein [Lewinella sp. W8]
MNIRLLLLSLLFILSAHQTMAQRLVPLAGHRVIKSSLKSAAPTDFQKNDCTVTLPENMVRILEGNTQEIKVPLDTLGLGGGFDDFRCLDCAGASFGTATLVSDTLTYVANTNVGQGLDTLRVTVCNEDGVCADTVSTIALVQRRGRLIELGELPVAPQGVTEVIVPTPDLPSGAVCRTVETCAPDYLGREQRASFITGIQDGNDYTYVAARYAGVDSVCVQLCNAFGLCDTYRSAFRIERPTRSLPFFDDFSYDDFRPDPELWQNEDVLINRTYAVLPPSIGVATFDAVNFDGQPYAPTNAGTSQIRDFLTSTPLDMTGNTVATLNFYLQPRGLGNRPETQDSFLLQFLDQNGNWNTVFSRAGLLNTVGVNTEVPFEPVTLSVPNNYLYDGFQFRFGAKSSEQGAVDMWHLDYVKLTGDSSTVVTQDIALVAPPKVLIEPYTSMPLRHLRGGGIELFRDTMELIAFNHRNDASTIGIGNTVVRAVPGNSAVSSTTLFAPQTFGDNDFSNQGVEVRKAFFPGTDYFQDIQNFLLNDANPNDLFGISETYQYRDETQDGFSPLILRNDTATTVTVFDEYFAYDDGSAEVMLEAQEGTVVVQRYTNYVPDKLTGVRLRIPRGLGSLGDQDLRIVIYRGDTLPEGDPVLSFDVPILFAEDFYRDSLQGFTSYELPEILELPEGNFFVGWEQLRANRSVGIGLDLNNQPGEVQFFDFGNGWEPLRGSIRGALMIRPLMAGADINPTSVSTPESEVPLLDVYPNPTEGTLHLRPRPGLLLPALTVRLFNLAGVELLRTNGVETLALDQFPAGLYLLEVSDGRRVSRHKIVRQ